MGDKMRGKGDKGRWKEEEVSQRNVRRGEREPRELGNRFTGL